MLTEYTDCDCQQCASTKCHDPDLHTLTNQDLTWIFPTSFNTVALASGDSLGDSLCSRLGARRSSLCQHQVCTTQAGTLGMASHTRTHWAKLALVSKSMSYANRSELRHRQFVVCYFKTTCVDNYQWKLIFQSLGVFSFLGTGAYCWLFDLPLTDGLT